MPAYPRHAFSKATMTITNSSQYDQSADNFPCPFPIHKLHPHTTGGKVHLTSTHTSRQPRSSSPCPPRSSPPARRRCSAPR